MFNDHPQIAPVGYGRYNDNLPNCFECNRYTIIPLACCGSLLYVSNYISQPGYVTYVKWQHLEHWTKLKDTRSHVIIFTSPLAKVLIGNHCRHNPPTTRVEISSLRHKVVTQKREAKHTVIIVFMG